MTPGKPLAVVALLAVACSRSTAPSASIVAARPAAPANGAQIDFYTQPVVLTVGNGFSTDASQAVRETVQVATDASFSNIVATVDVRPAGSTSTATLPALQPDTQYFWRVETIADGSRTPFSAAQSFRISPRSTLGVPSVIAPADGGYVPLRPTFIVRNASHIGPDGVIQYQFDAASDSGFTRLLASGAVAQGAEQTSFTPTSDLPATTAIYWRVQAIDVTHHESSGYGGGAFATPIVGPAALRIHTVTACTYVTSDFVVNGTATAGPTAWIFQSSQPALPPVAQLTVGSTGGTVVGGTWSTGDAATKCVPGPVNLITSLLIRPASVFDVSFVTPGRISGTFNGAIQMWNPFGDGGSSHQGTYSVVATAR